MEHRIEAEFVLSGPPPNPPAIQARLPALVAEVLDRSMGQRGEGRLADWSLQGDRLMLVLESSGARPHQALLAFARRFGEEFGKSERTGIRSLKVPRYRIQLALDPLPKGPISLPLPHELRILERSAELELYDLPEEAIRDNWMDRVATLVQEKARRQSYTGKAQYWALLTQRPARDQLHVEDPTEAMLRRHWIRNGPTKGKWFLGPTVTHLLRTMERIAREEVLHPLGFQEVFASHFDAFDTLLKTGHLEGLPGEFYYVVEPKSRDPAVWERFTDLVKITRQVPHDELEKLVTGPTAVLNYAQCPMIYWWLSGRTIATESLPLKVYDRAAISNRYESGGRHGLERVDEFHRIEPVFVGAPEDLVSLRAALLERYTRVFDSILELEWRTAWVTPFYMQQSGGVGVDDAERQIKGTIDFEAYLPYRGNRTDSEWLEFQNLSIVGDKYTRPFTIRTQKGELWSGCSGIGLERWLTSFLAQKGLDPQGWPDAFRRYVGELPSDIQFL
ncbi:MAG: serine--tRNA ligase [Thermoplasmata archaeon]